MAKKKAAKKTKAAAAKKAPKKRLPRQKQLPGIGDTKIAAIENAALDYAEKLDERKVLAQDCKDLKKRIHDLMRKAGKEKYERGGITIVVLAPEETVKLRVRDEDEIHAKDKKEPEEETESEPTGPVEPDEVEEPEGDEEEEEAEGMEAAS